MTDISVILTFTCISVAAIFIISWQISRLAGANPKHLHPCGLLIQYTIIIVMENILRDLYKTGRNLAPNMINQKMSKSYVKIGRNLQRLQHKTIVKCLCNINNKTKTMMITLISQVVGNCKHFKTKFSFDF